MHSIIFAKFLTDWRGPEREPNSSSTKLLIPNSSSISAKSWACGLVMCMFVSTVLNIN